MAAGTGSAVEVMLPTLLRPEDEDNEKMDETGDAGGEYEDARLKESDRLEDANAWFLVELSAFGVCEKVMVSQSSEFRMVQCLIRSVPSFIRTNGWTIKRSPALQREPQFHCGENETARLGYNYDKPEDLPREDDVYPN